MTTTKQAASPSSNYSTIRFIGYAIPTTPANVVAIGNPNGPGAVAGTYLAHDDLATDVAARVAVLKHAVDTAKAKLPTGEDPKRVINLFMAPEFFFHGVQGPYVFASEADDPVKLVLSALVAAFPAADYPNWTFVCGSAITTKVANVDQILASNSATVRNAVVEALSKQWLASFGPLNQVVFDMLVNFIKNCHSYPTLEVRNRAVIVSNIALDTPLVALSTNDMTTEKYYVSNEDFILYDVSGNKNAITEQMTAYPFIDLSNGDLKKSAYDKHAVFRQVYGDTNFPSYMDFGIEVCLDHSDVRLRRNIDNEPWPKPTDAIHIHMVPSCGMQINLTSVAADVNGFVFNTDGQYALDGSIGRPQQGVLADVDCIYVNYVDPTNAGYAGHSQLARVQTPATGGDPNRSGSTNATFQTLDPSSIAVVDVSAVPDLEKVFAGGPGQVHIYGLTTPYVLYP
jgi:hypothetical protein